MAQRRASSQRDKCLEVYVYNRRAHGSYSVGFSFILNLARSIGTILSNLNRSLLCAMRVSEETRKARRVPLFSAGDARYVVVLRFQILM